MTRIHAKELVGETVNPAMRRFFRIAGFLIAAAWVGSFAGAALAFTWGPIRGHNAIVPAFFLALFGVISSGFSAFIGWLASKAGGSGHGAGFRAVSFLSLAGTAGWCIWFFSSTQ